MNDEEIYDEYYPMKTYEKLSSNRLHTCSIEVIKFEPYQ